MAVIFLDPFIVLLTSTWQNLMKKTAQWLLVPMNTIYPLSSARNIFFRIVLVGRRKAGKSSLLATLIARKPILVAIDKRTRVVDVKTLELSEEDFLEVFDQGGHSIYEITRDLFICQKCTVFLVQNISKLDEMNETIKCLNQILNKHPNKRNIL